VITLQIPLHMIAAIDENKRDGESRAEYIRVAISQRLGDDQFAEELAALREPRG
jgi:Arc/MetJ-type ribon-helix-helix transcriptional regulator